jgi:transcriptional antiterminator RfaH
MGPRWYVIRAHHWQESRAEANLSVGGIETFLPSIRATSQRSPAKNREALFPQYLFARFDPHTYLHDVRFTRGVQSIVTVGGELATIDDEVIDFFRSRVDEDGLIPLGRSPHPGDHVTIASGPFAELTGIVERSLPARQRVTVLLATLGSPMRVQVPAEHVRG